MTNRFQVRKADIVLSALFLSTMAVSAARAACKVNVSAHGAVPNDTVSDSAAIQAAIAAVQTAGGGEVCFDAGTYRLTSAITWTVSAAHKPVVLAGVPGATILSPNGSDHGAIVVGGATSVSPGHFGIRDFIITPQSGIILTATVAAVEIGRGGQLVTGLPLSEVSGLLIQNYSVGLRVRGAAQVRFERIAVRGAKTSGVEILSQVGAPSPTSDLVFDQLSTSAGATGVAARIVSTGGYGIERVQLRNSHFSGGSPAVLISGRNGRASDVSINDSNVVTSNGAGVIVEAAGGAAFTSGVELSNTNVRAGTSSTAVILAATEFGFLDRVRVFGGTITSFGRGIDVWGRIRGVVISGVNFAAASGATIPPGSAAVTVNGAASPTGYPRGITVTGSTYNLYEFEVTSRLDHFVVLYPNVCGVSVTGNSANVVSAFVVDQTGAACPASQKALSPNAFVRY